MIQLKINGEWDTFETLNGYYSLQDVWKAYGMDSAKDPKIFMRTQGPHLTYSVQFRKYVWVSQAKVYQYCAWADPEFNALMEEALDFNDYKMATAIATGIIHK